MLHNAGVLWLHGDPTGTCRMLGSASLLTDGGGSTVGQVRYKPYGETRSASGNIYTEYHFTGQRKFGGIGLYNYGARFYDPLIGRFLSPDTVYDGGLADPQGLNRYSYVKGRVMNATDPTGHQGSCILTGSCPSPFYGGREGADLVAFLIGMGYVTGNAIAASDPSLSTPLNVAPSTSVNTSGTMPNVQPPLVLADPNNAAASAGGVEFYPTGQEAGGFQLTTPLGNSSTVQTGYLPVDIGSNIERLPNNQMYVPTKRGNAPVSSVDGKPIEIHHVGQNPDGPFREMNQSDHRGAGNDLVNHPNKTKPSLVERIQWRNDVRRYWKQEWDNNRWMKEE